MSSSAYSWVRNVRGDDSSALSLGDADPASYAFSYGCSARATHARPIQLPTAGSLHALDKWLATADPSAQYDSQHWVTDSGEPPLAGDATDQDEYIAQHTTRVPEFALHCNIANHARAPISTNFFEPSLAFGNSLDLEQPGLYPNEPTLTGFGAPTGGIGLHPIMPALALAQPNSALSMATHQVHKPSAPSRRAAEANGKPISCIHSGCQAKFGRGAELRRHLNTVHERSKRPQYKCMAPNCSYTYPRLDKVNSHMKKMHGLKVERIGKAGFSGAETEEDFED